LADQDDDAEISGIEIAEIEMQLNIKGLLGIRLGK
jgi:hypothetical protein